MKYIYLTLVSVALAASSVASADAESICREKIKAAVTKKAERTYSEEDSNWRRNYALNPAKALTARYESGAEMGNELRLWGVRDEYLGGSSEQFVVTTQVGENGCKVLFIRPSQSD